MYTYQHFSIKMLNTNRTLVPPLLSTSVHPFRDSENAYVSVFSNKNAQFLKNTTLRISSVWRPESPASPSPRPSDLQTFRPLITPSPGPPRHLVPPLLSTSVHPRWSSVMGYVSAFWGQNAQITRNTIVAGGKEKKLR